MQYKFHLNNLRISPRKVRLVSDLIKKMPVLEAEAQLRFQAKRASEPILKLLKSAVSGAVNNFNLLPENLYIYNVLVDKGPILKRFRPRAFGRAGAIHKNTSHITIILEEKTGAAARKGKTAVKEIKSEKLPVKEKKEKSEMIAPKEIKPQGKAEGATRRIFRRKAIG